MSADGTSTTITWKYNNIHKTLPKFYKTSLNTYIIYKLYKAETKIRIEEESLHLPQVCTEESPNYVSGSTTSHLSASRRMNLTQQGQKSTSGCPEIMFQQKPWATNTQQDLPNSEYT